MTARTAPTGSPSATSHTPGPTSHGTTDPTTPHDTACPTTPHNTACPTTPHDTAGLAAPHDAPNRTAARDTAGSTAPHEVPSPTAAPHDTLRHSRDPHERSLALVELGRLTEARHLAEHALATTDSPRPHLTLAWIALDRGDAEECARHLNAATFTGPDRVRAQCLRGLALCQQADPRLAITSLSKTIRVLRRQGDRRWLANALTGRGIARAYALRLAEADADFTAAHGVLTSLGEPDRAAMCLHNRGFVAMLAGNLPTALRHYEHAARAGLRTTRRPEALLDRAEALLSAGLIREARNVLNPAVDLLDRCDRGSRLPEALLLAARCALRDDDPTAARALAERAEALFRSQHRDRWVPAARAVALRAGAPGSATAVAAACERQGHHDDAAELRLTTEPHAIRRDHGTTRSRAIGWLARARLARTRRAAAAACAAGLRLHDPATWPGAELVDIALGHALAAGDAGAALRWTERRRADPPAPTRETADALAELRLARARDDHRRVVALEREVRRLSLAAGTVRRAAFPLSDLVDSLGDRALLSFTGHGGRLAAVCVTARGARLHDLGDARAAARRTIRLELSDDPDVLAAVDRVTAPAGDRPIVVVPSAELDRVPWAALPSCRGREVSVVPSASCWLAAVRRPLRVDRRVWVVGPSLRCAEREVRALRRAHGGERVSTVGEALHALERADAVHFAAHGVRRTDVPLFSRLELADGPVHGYDFDRLTRAPSVVVLSACDSGLAPALLRRGVRVVVASVRAVPDDRVVGLMVDLHAGLGTPARTLARAQLDHGDLGFVCFGAG
ncbi:CHAT domain-containing protein [Saccharothrix australiensis]|uniref:CHAT domain-containing protein n=1 Tax=Saccharothrix australiensis TaxID=2072 RepID=A0A495WB47_9PSEU|nr:CHAT domain-containing protein [Saccharothrix australiensis]RKT57963.1 CHAT domain-containing protein [Saccharothrix australiensis]